MLKHIISMVSAALLSLVLIAYVSPVLSSIEGDILPVTTRLVLEQITSIESSTQIYVSFTKLRTCEFKGINWYKGNVRIAVDFLEDKNSTTLTRLTGRQVTGPWRIHTEQLAGTRAVAVHRCHSLWLTYTPLYN